MKKGGIKMKRMIAALLLLVASIGFVAAEEVTPTPTPDPCSLPEHQGLNECGRGLTNSVEPVSVAWITEWYWADHVAWLKHVIMGTPYVPVPACVFNRAIKC